MRHLVLADDFGCPCIERALLDLHGNAKLLPAFSELARNFDHVGPVRYPELKRFDWRSRLHCSARRMGTGIESGKYARCDNGTKPERSHHAQEVSPGL